MKTWYLLIKNGYIIDCLTYSYKDYIKYESETIPVDVLSGWYLYNDGKIVLDETKKAEIVAQRRETIIDEYTLELINQGVL